MMSWSNAFFELWVHRRLIRLSPPALETGGCFFGWEKGESVRKKGIYSNSGITHDLSWMGIRPLVLTALSPCFHQPFLFSRPFLRRALARAIDFIFIFSLLCVLREVPFYDLLPHFGTRGIIQYSCGVGFSAARWGYGSIIPL